MPVEALDTPAFAVEQEAGRGILLEQVLQLVQRLRPLDRELVVLYLEGLNAAARGQIVGLSQGNVATKISRIKKLLARLAKEGRKEGIMISDPVTQALVETWGSQPASGFRLSPAVIVEKLSVDEKKVRRDFLLAGAMVALLIVWFGFTFASESDVVRRAGLAVIIGGLLYEVVQLMRHQRRVRAIRHNVNRTTADSLTAARTYLQARFEFLTGAWLWGRGVALLPGVPIVAFGFARDASKADVSVAGLPMAWVPAAWLALLIVATVSQVRIARRYRQQLDDLHRFTG